MPGIVVFKRRWSVGSDDFVVPGIFLLILHTIWLIILSVLLAVVDFGEDVECIADLQEHMLGYIVILSGCVVVEGFISWVSMRGTILNTAPRASMQYLLYVRLGILLVEVAWLIVGVIWVSKHYDTCPMGIAKEAVLGIIVCNWCVLLSVLVTVWCTFDAAGRTWVKMKRYNRSLKDGKLRYKRSGSSHRNWRHRKAVREYQDSWNKRCRLLFCCMGTSDRNRNSFAEIAKLLSEFFRDLDVVPSDVVAGLVLLRKFQRLERQAIANQGKNDTYQFLSGVPITSQSKFLDVNHPVVAEEVLNIIHYMHYALGVYGWPMFMMTHSGCGCCQLFPELRCCCGFHRSKKKRDRALVVEDNCCYCNYAALQKMVRNHNMEVVYATYHVEVGETPFFVAVDHEKRTVVVSIRGTLSLQDVLTDLNAEGEQLPVEPLHDDWLGHKGMVQAAEYIRKKLMEEAILAQAFNYGQDKGTPQYDLVLVGHSLGAGAAAILAILLRQEFPNLVCYAYSPPGGLLSLPAVEYTKTFITSVVLGKDVVPRIGLHQMEALRSDLINSIKRSHDPKWKIIMAGVLCCCPEGAEVDLEELRDMAETRDVTSHPSDSTIALTAHQPLYPPGKIIHIVRNHPKQERRFMRKNEPVYQALWADNKDFDQVLISPVMVQDHMPDKVLHALEKLLVNTGPAKPQRKLTELERRQLLSPSADTLDSPASRTPPHCLVLETSFTDLHPSTEQLPTSWENSNNLAYQVKTLRIPCINNNNESFEEQSNSSYQKKSHKVDLIHDDWLGWAPLASPETMSEVSSVSSKGSHHKGNNHQSNGASGARLSWGGVPMMEPIAQSPAVHRPEAYIVNSAVHHHPVLESPYYEQPQMSPPPEEHHLSLDFPRQQVTTQATVEVQPSWAHPEDMHREVDPSRLCLNFESNRTRSSGLLYTSEGDSTYASTSTEQTVDRLFTPREAKHVTFELFSSQESQDVAEESADSMYNSGESFVPTYPEYNTQHEYGGHLYMYPCYSYSNHTPSTSPTPPPRGVHCDRDASVPLHIDYIVTSSPRSRRKRVTIDPEFADSSSSSSQYTSEPSPRPPPTESSL